MKILYLGSDPSNIIGGEVTHLPLIETHPLPFSLKYPASSYTHIIFTSKQAVHYFCHVKPLYIEALAIGPYTARAITTCSKVTVAKEFTQEGVLELFKVIDPQASTILYPRSCLARPFLAQKLKEKGYKLDVIDLYETKPLEGLKLPSLAPFDEIHFTSPSVVRAFFSIYEGPFLTDKFIPIGPITEKILLEKKEAKEHSCAREQQCFSTN